MWLSNLKRGLYHIGLVALSLLLMGLFAASASARSMSSPPMQGNLPTRPPSSQPPAPKPTSAPRPPDGSDRGPAPTPAPTAIPRPGSQVTATDEGALSASLGPSVDLTFEELGYGDLLFSEPRSRRVSIDLPGNLVPNNARSYLDLIVSHVPPEPGKPSVVKVSFNDTPIGVIALSPDNAGPTTYRYYFENAPLTPGRNTLLISLDTGGWCNIKGATVDLTIHDSSSFHVEYTLSPLVPDLALYPVPFFERSFEYEPVYVVLPDSPSATDLSAAATIAAGLGKLSGGEASLVSVLDTEITAEVQDNHHLIVVGKRGENQLLEQLDH